MSKNYPSPSLTRGPDQIELKVIVPLGKIKNTFALFTNVFVYGPTPVAKSASSTKTVQPARNGRSYREAAMPTTSNQAKCGPRPDNPGLVTAPNCNGRAKPALLCSLVVAAIIFPEFN